MKNFTKIWQKSFVYKMEHYNLWNEYENDNFQR